MSSKKCLTRVSHKSVKQELLNRVKQGCPTRVSPQCVNSGCLTSEFVGNVTNKYCLCLSTYVSAFGFVGFILFERQSNATHHLCQVHFEARRKDYDEQEWAVIAKGLLVRVCWDDIGMVYVTHCLGLG